MSFTKQTLTALALIACTAAADAQQTAGSVTEETAAETRRSSGFGVRASFEITSPATSASDYNNGAGFSLGAVYRFELPRNFYFEPGLLGVYTTLGIKRPVEEQQYFYEGSARNFSFRVPLNVGYTFALPGTVDLSIYTGPWLNFGVTAKEYISPNFEIPVPDPALKDNNLYKKGWKHFHAQWGFGLSVTFARHYHVGLSGGISFTPLASYGNKDNKIRVKSNVFAISVGYNF